MRCLNVDEVTTRTAIRIGERVRYFRERAGFSQIDLHAQSGISLAHISRVENGVGNPTIETLTVLAIGLGCSLVDLVQEADPKA
ncbi:MULTISPECIES: helix-turn-helix transcriptional regulator [unclassified Novosphingobium]|uniref:helix-turn-helix domain-containing protein n=1 Tax=unclassified Novosphingobium TaxID=2644732 RepID=UPI00146B3ED1|nr:MULTISPECIES: helix-turn-helix transcriptional regulator [unclassified Novosphingobium]NMN07558.1 transcriptional regulator with XRE-family HTH domain [Novosphingobium sp. SG919]NMN89839.1 transcriptional regulator with XRE-family HTH domain [Novosphingobium sp. SG916]